MKLSKKTAESFYNVELMRFVGIILIMGHHLYLLGAQGEYNFFNCWAWVDFFFILTGAFTYKHFEKETQQRNYGSIALSYTFTKFARFLPYTLISVIVMCFWQYGYMLVENKWKGFISFVAYSPFEVFFLTSSGITGAMNAPIWFLSAMFIVMPVMVYIILANKELWKVLAFLLPILYFGQKGVNTQRGWNDLVRAFVCMALGTMAYMLALKIREYIGESAIKKTILSCLELILICASIFISVLNKPYINLLEPIFVFMVALLLSQKTFSADIKLSIFVLLGKMSMPMFIFHWCVGCISTRLTWDFKIRLLIYYIGTILIGFLVVIINKYLISRKI